MPTGELSEYGVVEGDCMLTGVFEFHFFVAFQQPGQPYGTEVGPPRLYPGTAVEQFVIIFRNE